MGNGLRSASRESEGGIYARVAHRNLEDSCPYRAAEGKNVDRRIAFMVTKFSNPLRSTGTSGMHIGQLSHHTEGAGSAIPAARPNQHAPKATREIRGSSCRTPIWWMFDGKLNVDIIPIRICTSGRGGAPPYKRS